MMIDPKNRGITLIEVLVVVAIIGLLVALILPAVLSSRAAARKLQCSNNLRQLGLSINAYQASEGVYPAGTQGRGYSLHVQVLPYMEQLALYNAINHDTLSQLGMINATAQRVAVSTFTCPADGEARAKSTNYAGNIGTGFADDLPLDNGGVALDAATCFGPARVGDGTSNTVAMSEWLVVFTSSSTRAINRVVMLTNYHTGGKDDFRDFLAECDRLDPTTANVSAFKGYDWMNGAPSMTLYNQVYPPNGRSCGNGPLIRTSAFTAGSLHGPMAHCLFLDGHVAPARDEVDPAVWRAIGTRAGGESSAAAL